MNTEKLYDTDFNSWIHEHILLLKEARFSELDTTHLIEELEDMAKRDKRELVSNFTILIAHLLKWQYQPIMRSNSWSSTIDEHRARIELLLNDMPSLKNCIDESIEKSYFKAIKLASKNTKLPISIFPERCSYKSNELLDEDFYPSE